MMMDGSHLKDAFFAQLKGADLKHHGKHLRDEHATDDHKQQFLLNADRGGA